MSAILPDPSGPVQPSLRARSDEGGGSRGRSSTRAVAVLGAWLLVAVSFSALPLGCDGGSAGPPSGSLDRGTVFVEVTEALDGETTDLNISELLITRALLHHGLHLAPEEDARYRFEGRLSATFHQRLTMELGGVEQLLEHQWLAEFEGTLTDRGEEGSDAKERTEVFAFPEPLLNGRTDEELARRDIRRRSATIIARDVTRGEILGQPRIAGLLDALLDPFDPRTFDEIERDLVDEGLPAVPYLLDALADERAVRLEGTYPGLEEWNREELKVHHIADRALSEILGRTAGLDLLSTKERRLRVIIGWTWAWEDVQGVPTEWRVDPEARTESVPDP